MIKIEFSGLSEFTGTYKYSQIFEGFLIPANRKVVNVSTNWGGNTYPIQSIYYDSYEFNLVLRDADRQEFEKIQFADRIAIYETATPEYYMLDEYSTDQDGEFWVIKIKVSNIASKKVENICLKNYDKLTTANTLSIGDIISTPFSTFVKLPKIEDVEIQETIASEVVDKLVDYTAIKEYYKLRFYLLAADLITFVTYLTQVGQFSDYKLKFKSLPYDQYKLEKDDVGEGLYQITLTLYKNNRLTVPNYQTPT